MRSAFADAVEIFGAQGVAVIPTAPDKPSMPMVKNPEKFRVGTSRTLLGNPRYARANAGIWTGTRSKLTIVDIDSTDPSHVADAIKVFGDTPLKVSTPSGGLHLYFRYGGERRRIRPLGKALPLDVLGSGLAAIPPSSRQATKSKAGGVYQIVEGDLRDLSRLPPLRPGSLPHLTSEAHVVSDGQRTDFAALRDGDGRDDALFRYAREMARICGGMDELLQLVLVKNAEMAEPLSDAIATAKAHQAWRYKQKGSLLVAGSRAALMDRSTLFACLESPAALSLLTYLKIEHSLDHVFAVVPEAVAAVLGMGHNTVRRARGFLLEVNLLELVEKGGLTRDGKKPNLYRLKPSPQNGRE